MFTGLIEVTGVLRRRIPRGPGVSLVIGAPRDLVQALTLGESVAVDGACLTVTRASGAEFEVDASSETLERTTLSDVRPGTGLHLERALRVGDRLGGHLVTGHVDAVGSVRKRAALGQALEMWFDAPEATRRYLVPKGSITIDGISLTVNQVDAHGFSVVLIPHTQTVVRLHTKRVGEAVNLEADILGKYIERLLAIRSGDAEPEHTGIDLDALGRAGFLNPTKGHS